MYDFSFLRQLRKRDDLTIGDVSARSGISTAVISKLERNQTRAELETLFKLSRVFGLTTNELVALAESRTSQRANSVKHVAGGFVFREIAYSNVRCLFGAAPKGARVSRPEIHRDDYEVCWVLSGNVRFTLPDERHELTSGEAIQFDAILHHTYEALEDSEIVIIHLRKGKRF
jgi:transcriptional regulator with XRE-family HTH domain